MQNRCAFVRSRRLKQRILSKNVENTPQKVWQTRENMLYCYRNVGASHTDKAYPYIRRTSHIYYIKLTQEYFRMNAKQLKFLSLFEDMCKADPVAEATVKKFIPSFLNLDYSMALDVWDYLCSAHEDVLGKTPQASNLIGCTVLDLFYKKGAPKTVKGIADMPAVRRMIYQYAPSAGEGTAFAILVDLLSGNKVDAADDIFKCLVRNERIAYGKVMKALLERLFIEILKKNPAKKIEMSRKLSALLLTYVSKIKTDERAMLEQRIRETM